MTVYKGMLLFDIAEPSINGWENQLGYRGMMEVWKKDKHTIYIEPYDESSDEDEEWEAWVGNEETGDSESIAFGTFDEADKQAKQYMAKH